MKRWQLVLRGLAHYRALHLGALLGLYAGLSAEAAQGQGAPSRLARRAAAALLHEHLASWCFVYLSRVGELDGGAYGRWAALLREALMDRMQGAMGSVRTSILLWVSLAYETTYE